DLTITDPLTGLRNRRFLLQRIDEDVALALRQGTDLVFFLVDVDHFKKVNDELGHAAGDLVLRQMRGRLEQVFRASDYVLRWGGEEFLAVARGSARADAPRSPAARSSSTADSSSSRRPRSASRHSRSRPARRAPSRGAKSSSSPT